MSYILKTLSTSTILTYFFQNYEIYLLTFIILIVTKLANTVSVSGIFLEPICFFTKIEIPYFKIDHPNPVMIAM